MLSSKTLGAPGGAATALRQTLQRVRVCVASTRRFSASPSTSTEKVFKRRISIHITGVTHEGDGLGVDAASGVQVQVPFALPGEELLVDVWERDLVASQKWQASKREPKWPVFGQRVDGLASSPHRIEPQCKVFGACGGCKQQHFAYAEQLRHKALRIHELFADRTHSPVMQVRSIIGADSASGIYHYRNKMEFTCSTGRWLLDSDKVLDGEVAAPSSHRERDDAISDSSATPQHFPFTIGLFPVASTSVRRARQIGGKRRRGKTNASWSPRIVSIDACALQTDTSNAILRALASDLEAAGLAAFNFQTQAGFLKQLVLRSGVNATKQTEVMIGLVTTTLDGDATETLKRVVQAFVDAFHAQASGDGQDAAATIVSVVQRLDDQSIRASGASASGVITREQTLYGQPFFHDTILDHTFQVSFDSFFQPNTAQATRLYRAIRETLALELATGAEERAPGRQPVIWDLFCGVGSIGISMGTLGAKVYGFEIVDAAVERARVNAELNGYDASTMQFFPLDLTKRWDDNAWSDVVEHPDVVIVDPPRAGLHRKLVKMLRRLAPQTICYVSCNPESQVRDLELLCQPDDDRGSSSDDGTVRERAVYDVTSLQPVDMLPHTPHIETIAWLRKRDEARGSS